MTDLSGTWVAAPADDELLRTFTDPSLDDSAWESLQVPGHWRSAPTFAHSDGPLLYRTHFDTPARDGRHGDGARDWLVLDGVFYQSDIWLDDAYVGDSEGYFFPHAYDITSRLAERAEHLLAIEVGCEPQRDRTAKRNLTGVFQHSDCLPRDWNPGGIWRPVRIEQSGPVRIRHFRTLCSDATTESATVFVRAVLDSTHAGAVDVVTTVAGEEHTESHPLASGENRMEWTVTVPEPELWWPHSLGGQPLHDLTVEVKTESGGVSDTRSRRIGFRSVELDDYVFRINGERLFVKGSNQGPTQMALGEADGDHIARDVGLAIDANLDMLRVHAHITRPEFYDAADEAGLILWQDLPLQRGYSRSVRKQARRQAREAVDLLAHHPSVVVWCGHNEPIAIEDDAGMLGDPKSTRRTMRRVVAGQFLPSWNKTVLDHSIRRVLERNDPSRPVIPHSGILPHPPQLDGTDAHLYFGWYHGEERDLPGFLRKWPRAVRFVSEFGAQAVPVDAGFCEPERWPDLDWERLGRDHSLQKSRFDVYVPPADHDSFEAWAESTQGYQALLLKHHIEALRRVKYRPTGGFLQFCFADAYPGVTWSILDHNRRPKPALDVVRAACAPVIVVAGRLPLTVEPGESMGIDVHVVTDGHEPLIGGEATARLHWADGGEDHVWTGDVEADSCQLVGRIETTAPPLAGALALDLEYRCGDLVATNRYTTVVVA